MSAFLFACTLAQAASSSSTGRPLYPLMVGDVAPKLEVSRWVQGQPVKTFEPGTVYVLDFWSTWCGPCIESMPKLSQMQREYGQKVIFIGVDVWDYQERVAPFVARMGEKLSYRVALDTLPLVPKGEGNIPMWAKDNGKCAQKFARGRL
ncbi:MAG: TlpA family protein disulfide reductase [Chlorobia bacterium]|nr:TlpA family protein disulfide reductase [Fimbriimonadaceae bacterium]